MKSFRAVVVVVAMLGCAPSMEVDASLMDAPDVPPGCCPISPGPDGCGCSMLIGGSPGPLGCGGPVCDFFPARRVVDENGCPMWLDDDPCRHCLLFDAGPNCDSGPR